MVNDFKKFFEETPPSLPKINFGEVQEKKKLLKNVKYREVFCEKRAKRVQNSAKNKCRV
jgi:hypothetical protein